MRVLKSENDEIAIRGTVRAAIIYYSEFGADLMGDWGLVEYKVNAFTGAKIGMEAANEEYEKLCENVGDPLSEEGRDKLSEEQLKKLQFVEEVIVSAQKTMQENYDLEMVTLLQIIYAMNAAQIEKDGGDAISFEDWTIKHDEIRVMDIWDDLLEEVQKFFLKSGTPKEEK